MTLKENTRNIRCDFGLCKKKADLVIVFDRMGIGSHYYICEECLKNIISLYKSYKESNKEKLNNIDKPIKKEKAIKIDKPNKKINKIKKHKVITKK